MNLTKITEMEKNDTEIKKLRCTVFLCTTTDNFFQTLRRLSLNEVGLTLWIYLKKVSLCTSNQLTILSDKQL